MNTTTTTTTRWPISRAVRFTGGDGAKHYVWAFSPKDAKTKGTQWGYRHGGLALLELITEAGIEAVNAGTPWDSAAAEVLT